MISRHKNDINETLDTIKLSKFIFKDIIIIKDINKKKSDFILENSIFIDDSFKERNDVANNVKNVLCFDIDFFEYIFI